MKKTISILLVAMLLVLASDCAVFAQSILNVEFDKDTKTVSVSGTFDTKYADSVAGLYGVKQDYGFPDFSVGGYSDVFITIQDTVVDGEGNFTFEDINISDAEGNLSFTVAVMKDIYHEEMTKSIYVPTKESVDNFFEVLGQASSGDDVLTLINADMDNTLIDGKNVQIGLDKNIYLTYPQIDKAVVADKIFDKVKNQAVTNATQFDKLHTLTALECAFLASGTPDEVWSFINIDTGDAYYMEMASALELERTKTLSVVKKLAEYDSNIQADVVLSAANSDSLDEWLEKMSLYILNMEMTGVTDSYVQKMISDYSDIFENLDFEKYNSLTAYQGEVAGAVLAAAPYTSVKALCDVANQKMSDIEFRLNNSMSAPSLPAGGGGGGGGGVAGGGFTAQTAPVTQSEPIPEAKEVFDDISSVEWASQAITALNGLNIINGKQDGKFCPNDYITREEFVKIIVLAFEKYNANASCAFGDVASDDWFAPYVASAFDAGLVNGVSKDKFGVGMPVSRQDAATMLCRIIKATADKSDISKLYSDYEDVSDYARDAVAALSKLGIVNGMADSKFCPALYCTRAQAAKMIYETLRRE